MTKNLTKIFLHYLLLLVGPPVVWLYLRITQLSSKIVVEGRHIIDEADADTSGFIFAFWHNRQIMLPIVLTDKTVHCLISNSKDGDYVAGIVQLFGKKAIRGSSSRGGFEAMRQMIRMLRAGDIVVITPDGPRGPAGQVDPGIIQVARATDVPIIPVAFDASRKKVFSSWDKYILPYPFGKISIVFGKPVKISADKSIESGCLQLGEALNACVSNATVKLED